MLNTPKVQLGEALTFPSSTGKIYDQGAQLSGVPSVQALYNLKGQGFEYIIADNGSNPHSNLETESVEAYGYRNTNTHDGHGNLTQGILNMQGNPMTGVVPDAKCHQRKFIGFSGGSYYDFNSICKEALAYTLSERTAGRRGITHINGSFGGPPDQKNVELEATLEELKKYNIKVFLASGNEYKTQSLSYPGFLSSVFGIGAISFDQEHALFSNGSDDIDFVAWGVGVVSTDQDNSHRPWQGTSAACPYAMALAILIDQHYFNLFGRLTTWSELYSILMYYADDLGALGFDVKYGHGLVNLKAIEDDFKGWCDELGYDPAIHDPVVIEEPVPPVNEVESVKESCLSKLNKYFNPEI